jgi:hypothetical protein
MFIFPYVLLDYWIYVFLKKEEGEVDEKKRKVKEKKITTYPKIGPSKNERRITGKKAQKY